MFFYLSFLRTPPHSSSQSSPVVLTPQVSNDLRTEPFPTSVDIFYWWISCTPQSVTRLSEPTKLTTWRQENAYKPLQVSPPPRDVIGPTGIECSLVLSPEPIVGSSVIDLRDPEIGRAPLPVCTLPIRISSKQDGHAGGASTAKPAKQEAITRTFRLFDGDASPLMRIKETISFDLDKVMPGSQLLAFPPSLFLSRWEGEGRFPSLSWRADMGLHTWAHCVFRNCGTAESA